MDLPPSIDSKFRFILIAAKRARQLQAGARALVQTPYKKQTKIAMAELSAGLVPVEIPGSASSESPANDSEKL